MQEGEAQGERESLAGRGVLTMLNLFEKGK